jgi:hypothetical protein
MMVLLRRPVPIPGPSIPELTPACRIAAWIVTAIAGWIVVAGAVGLLAGLG